MEKNCYYPPIYGKNCTSGSFIITSVLIKGGRTAHSRFKIPLNIFENNTYEIKHKTHLAELICQTDLVV